MNFTESENGEVTQFIKESRDVYKCTKQQLLLMSLAWVLPKERDMFTLFPEVITVDCTADTNNESRPLLTMGGKDANGKVFMFLRVFLPNEKRWIFRWVFNIVLHKFFHKDVLNRIKLIISDGDQQECGSIDNAIGMFMKGAKRARCGWHIVNRNFSTHVLPKKSFPGKETDYDNITLIVQN